MPGTFANRSWMLANQPPYPVPGTFAIPRRNASKSRPVSRSQPGARHLSKTQLDASKRRAEQVSGAWHRSEGVPGTDQMGAVCWLWIGFNQTDRTDCLNERMVRSAALWESGSGKTSALRNPR